MSVAELKTGIMEKVKMAQNEKLLTKVADILNVEFNQSDFFELTDDDWKNIKTAQAEYERGESYSHEKKKEIMKEWLKD